MVRKGVCQDQSRSLLSGSASVQSTYFGKLVSINGNDEVSNFDVMDIYILLL